MTSKLLLLLPLLEIPASATPLVLALGCASLTEKWDLQGFSLHFPDGNNVKHFLLACFFDWKICFLVPSFYSSFYFLHTKPHPHLKYSWQRFFLPTHRLSLHFGIISLALWSFSLSCNLICQSLELYSVRVLRKGLASACILQCFSELERWLKVSLLAALPRTWVWLLDSLPGNCSLLWVQLQVIWHHLLASVSTHEHVCAHIHIKKDKYACRSSFKLYTKFFGSFSTDFCVGWEGSIYFHPSTCGMQFSQHYLP